MIDITVKIKVENPGEAHQLLNKLRLQNPGIEITEATGPDPETGQEKTYTFTKDKPNQKVEQFLKPKFGKPDTQEEPAEPRPKIPRRI
jgi:hypothetical protein